jgi:hypothetical protein
VNPALVVPLPPAVRQRAGELLRAAPGALALHEPVQPAVRHEARGTTPSTMPGRDILFWAELRYRVVVAAGRDAGAVAASPAAAGAATAAGAPVQWFHVALLVPDADALRQMTAPTTHFYRHVTGRLGGGSRDCYWYLDAWERFHEEGQRIGCVSPDLVTHGHVGGVVRARAPRRPAPPTIDELLAAEEVAPRAPQYTPEFDRRGFVPPGYCLVHYFATVEVATARRAPAGAAA